jgi:serine protease AprX
MTIIDAIRRSGSRAANPNDSIGYGVPDVKKATIILLKRFATSSAAISGCKASINWTSKDVNTMRYEIERKNPGSGTYVKVGQVSGTGTSFSAHSYQFEDPVGGVNAGTISYRIRQVVDTSVAGFAADYIDTTTVSLATNCAVITALEPVDNGNSISLVPNPARDRVYLKINTTEPVKNLQIRIINSKGQAVNSFRKSKGSGPAVLELFTGNMASGKYYVSIFDGEKLIATKELMKL